MPLKKTPIPYEQLKEIILNYQHKNQTVTKRTKAMIAFQYVLACRIGELIPYHHPARVFKKPIKNKTERSAFDTVGLLKNQIKEYPTYWEVTIPNFKQTKGSSMPEYKQGFILKDSKEDWLRDVCFDWINSVEGNVVFPIKIARAKGLIGQALKPLGIDLLARTITREHCYNTHHLRNSRADHLLKIFNFNIVQVKESLGHKSLASTQAYIGSNITDRVKQLQEATT